MTAVFILTAVFGSINVGTRRRWAGSLLLFDCLHSEQLLSYFSGLGQTYFRETTRTLLMHGLAPENVYGPVLFFLNADHFFWIMWFHTSRKSCMYVATDTHWTLGRENPFRKFKPWNHIHWRIASFSNLSIIWEQLQDTSIATIRRNYTEIGHLKCWTDPEAG